MKSQIDLFKQRYTKDQLAQIFLICAFPLHLWTILIFINDIGWITERSNLWGAVGAGAYSFLYTFLESILYFVSIIILSFLIPWKFEKQRVFAIIGYLSLILSFWSGIGNYLRSQEFLHPDVFVTFLVESGHPLRYGVPILALFAFLILISTSYPIYLLSFKNKFLSVTLNTIEKLSFLSILYLALDLAAIIIILIRNFS